jgi:FkbM family methyltransferase
MPLAELELEGLAQPKAGTDQSRAWFTRLSVRQTARALRLWGLHVAESCLRTSVRFLVLAPPFLQTQTVIDKRHGTHFRIRIRDVIDWNTTVRIFFKNELGLEGLKRHAELKAHYDRIVASGAAPLIVDCGANIGLAARYFSETYPEADIVCIEPEAGNAGQARLNNPREKTLVVEAAVGSSDGRCELLDPGLGNDAFRVVSSNAGKIRILSINTLLDKLGNERRVPFIAKVDIEGFESELFSANTEWIDRFPILIIELHDWMLPGTANSRNFLREIAKRDRDFIYSGEIAFSIANTNCP